MYIDERDGARVRSKIECDIDRCLGRIPGLKGNEAIVSDRKRERESEKEYGRDHRWVRRGKRNNLLQSNSCGYLSEGRRRRGGRWQF